MTTKNFNKKNPRQKRLIRSVGVSHIDREVVGFDLSSLEGREKAIVRQFNQIQKDYSRLMMDVVKEFDLLKGWLGTQASIKRNEIKSRLSARLNKDIKEKKNKPDNYNIDMDL